MNIDGSPRLPGLSVEHTRWLVAEAQRVLTDLGLTSTVVDGVSLTLADERTLGLDNLARTISRMPRRIWARAVRDQLSALAHARPERPPETVDLRVKLWPKARADGFLGYKPLEPLPGIVAVVAAQGDRVSHEFGTLDLVGDRDEAYDHALTNLAGLSRPRHARRRVDPHIRSSWVEFLDSNDAYGAARVTVLPEIIRRVLRTDFPAHGVLVAVPTKFELWVHVPVDDDVIRTALAMSRLARRAFVAEPYPISPNVFLVSPDMHATTLVGSDRRGCQLDHPAALDLLRTLDTAQRRAAG